MAPEQGGGLTFIGMAAVCWLDFKQKIFSQVDTLSLFPMGGLNLPSASDLGVTRFENNILRLGFEVTSEGRRLVFETHGKGQGELKGNILLTQARDADDMVMATSWKENPRAFYYNHR